MATTNIYLRNPNSDKPTPIILILSADNKQSKYSTGERIHPRYWDKKKQRVKSSFTGCIEMNILISEKEQQVLAEYRKIKTNGKIPSPLKIRESTKEEEMSNTDFYTGLEHFIEIKSQVLDPKTISKYKTLKTHLKSYQKTKPYKLTYDNINLAFDEQFKIYLNAEGNLNDTVSKYVSSLKTYMGWALDYGYHDNVLFRKFDSSKKQKNEIVTLKEDELSKLLNFDLKKNKRLERVRDLFIFACFTGQRWSDIIDFKDEDFDIESKEWKFRSKKSKKTLTIPLTGFLSPALDILNKYDFNLPKMSAQKFNEYIKEVGELAKINAHVKIHREKGHETVTIQNPKYKFMSCHMGRRTFITILMERGAPPTVIMKLTGHTSLKTLMKYENTGKDAIVRELERVGKLTTMEVI